MPESESDQKLYDSGGLFLRTDAPADWRERNESFIGKTIGNRYRVVSLIGGGTVSTVFKAKDLSNARTVALKLMPECRSLSRDTLKIFEHDARLSVTHPHLVTVHACGLTEDGAPWLAMEYLEATTLAQVLRKEGPLPVDRVVKIFKQLSDALAYVHSKGEVHMNLKPSNILLMKPEQAALGEGEPDGEAGEPEEFVKIADFGIGKIALERELQLFDQKLPRTASAFYMSPEQFQGQRIEAQCDIYAMGCILYEALSGKPPLVGLNLLDTMDRHINQPPVPIVDAARDRSLPPRLAGMVARMLQKDPSKRYRNAAEVSAALDKVYQPGESSSIILQAVSEGMSEEISTREHPIFFIAFALSTLLLVATICFAVMVFMP